MRDTGSTDLVMPWMVEMPLANLGRVMLLGLGLLAQPSQPLASEATFCGELHRIIAASQAGFADLASATAGEDGRYPATLILQEASACSVSRPPGTASYHCVWEFPLQKPAAYAKYKTMEQETDACIGSQATPKDDQGVNHPDFYAARRFELHGAAVIVSVKDKSILNRTLVNLWVVVVP